MKYIYSARRIIYTIIITAVLLLSLLLSLASCSTAQGEGSEHSDQLPHLMTKIKVKGGVREGVLHPDGSIYFTGRYSISRIYQDEAAGAISLPKLHPNGIRLLEETHIAPDTELIYSIDKYGDAIHIISETEVVTTLLDVTEGPRHTVIDEDTEEVYIFYTSQSVMDDRFRALVLSGTEIITEIVLPFAPLNAASFNPLDGHIYVAGHKNLENGNQSNAIFAIDDHEVINYIQPLDSNPHLAVVDMAMNPDNGDVYTLLNTKLSYWDRVNPPQSYDFYAKGYRNPSCITIDPTRELVYVCVWTEGGSYVLAMTKDGIEEAIPVPDRPQSSAWDSKHDYVYIGHYDPTYLSLIRGTEVITTLDIIGYGTRDIIVDEANNRIYAANADDSSISIFGYPDEPSANAVQSFWQRFFPFVSE